MKKKADAAKRMRRTSQYDRQESRSVDAPEAKRRKCSKKKGVKTCVKCCREVNWELAVEFIRVKHTGDIDKKSFSGMEGKEF